MDSEAEATITKRYYNFQNRKFPMIRPKVIPKPKYEPKDGIIVRPIGYNYIYKNYPKEKIKLKIIEQPEVIDPLYMAYLNIIREGGLTRCQTRDYYKNPPGFSYD